MKIGWIVALVFLLATLSGCSNAQEKSTGGAVIGTVLGGVIGHQSGETEEGALIGGAVGAVLGYMVGNEQDKDELSQQRRNGHWEHRDKKTWVPGTTEKRWVPPSYDTRYDDCGEPYRILVAEGHYEVSETDGYWVTAQEKYWVND